MEQEDSTNRSGVIHETNAQFEAGEESEVHQELAPVRATGPEDSPLTPLPSDFSDVVDGEVAAPNPSEQASPAASSVPSLLEEEGVVQQLPSRLPARRPPPTIPGHSPDRLPGVCGVGASGNTRPGPELDGARLPSPPALRCQSATHHDRIYKPKGKTVRPTGMADAHHRALPRGTHERM
ncbi:hypothetical protein JB92DRAFT_2827759 [Gautieria morchelliformis]|nr:hypothetical protein JB92DRAFT_2827759 [Gautieria morchelliformis]